MMTATHWRRGLFTTVLYRLFFQQHSVSVMCSGLHTGQFRTWTLSTGRDFHYSTLFLMQCHLHWKILLLNSMCNYLHTQSFTEWWKTGRSFYTQWWYSPEMFYLVLLLPLPNFSSLLFPSQIFGNSKKNKISQFQHWTCCLCAIFNQIQVLNNLKWFSSCIYLHFTQGSSFFRNTATVTLQ